MFDIGSIHPAGLTS